jgi:uncharacterized protein
MNVELSALEARVVGCLIEKQITTPDQYPLSLNALTNACNQKNNRDPVLDLNERAVQQVLEGLVRKHMVIERSGFGSRVPKYQHVFCNTEFGSLKFSPIETAIVCELLLRGAQMPGELRSRANRMSPIADVSEVESALQALMTRQDGPFVVRLAREPGRRESRYVHLFSGPIDAAADDAPTMTASAPPAIPPAPIPPAIDEDRLSRLEALVESLCKEIEALKQKVG